MMMSSVNLWKARQLLSAHRIAPSPDCACAVPKCGKPVAKSQSCLARARFILSLQQNFPSFSKQCSQRQLKWFRVQTPELRRMEGVAGLQNNSGRWRRGYCREISGPRRAWSGPGRNFARCIPRGKTYCSASINRVIVRFSSLSDRRISSILLIECRTVV